MNKHLISVLILLGGFWISNPNTGTVIYYSVTPGPDGQAIIYNGVPEDTTAVYPDALGGYSVNQPPRTLHLESPSNDAWKIINAPLDLDDDE